MLQVQSGGQEIFLSGPGGTGETSLTIAFPLGGDHLFSQLAGRGKPGQSRSKAASPLSTTNGSRKKTEK